jgi:hypothetical protein
MIVDDDDDAEKFGFEGMEGGLYTFEVAFPSQSKGSAARVKL